MTITFDDLINDCMGYLYSFGVERDKVTSLSQNILAGDLTLPVLDASQIDRGIIEIDLEQINVMQSDNQSNTVTIHPWGRGQNSTAAVAHTANTKITNTPRFPRSQIGREINFQSTNLFPDLFWVKQDVTQRYIPSIRTYALPADAREVLSLSYEDIGPSKEWVTIDGWRMDFDAATNSFPTGKTITLYTPVYPGRTLKIVYAAEFPDFVNPTDTMTSVGLNESWRDIVCYLTSARLLTGLEAQRLLTDTIEASYRQNLQTGTTPTQATSVSRAWMQFAQQRIQSERRLLLNQHPGGLVRVR